MMDIKCPECGSNNVRYRPKRNNWICDDCDCVFEATGSEAGTQSPRVQKRVFISYGHDYRDYVLSVAQCLRNRQIDVWTDDMIPESSSWRETITQSILQSDIAVAFLSKHSVRPGGVCLDELAIAVGCGLRVITVLLDKEAERDIPSSINGIQYIDLCSHIDADAAADILEKYILEGAAKDQLTEYLRIRLNQPGMSDRLSDLKQPFQQRQWLDRRISDWFDKRRRSLLLEAYPGAGKSFYCSHFFHFNPMTASLIFCDDVFYGRDRLSGIIMKIAYSLSGKYPEYRTNLMWMLNAHPGGLDELSHEELMDLLIVRPLQLNIDGQHPISLIVIDGVDLLDESERTFLIERFLGYSSRLPDYIGILFTARQNMAVNSLFTSEEILTILPDGQDTFRDIEAFLRKTIPSLSESECSVMARRCHGSFLFARLLAKFVQDGGADIESIQPGEIYRLYLITMKRLAVNAESFRPWATAFSILAQWDRIPVSIFSEALGWDDSVYAGFRERFLSLTEISYDAYGEKVISLIYPSFRSWLLEQDHDFRASDRSGKEAMSGLVMRTPVNQLHRYLLRHLPEFFVYDQGTLGAIISRDDSLLRRILQEGASCLSDSMHFTDAELYFRICESLVQTGDIHTYIRQVLLPYFRAKKAFGSGEFQVCEKLLKSIHSSIEEPDLQMDAIYMLGTSCDILGKRKEAAELFVRLMKLSESETGNAGFHIKALCGLLWLDHFNNLADSKVHLEKLKQFGGLSPSESILRDLILARHYLSEGELKASLELFEKVAEGNTSEMWGYDSVSCRNQMLLIEAVVACFDNNLFERGIELGREILGHLEGHGSIAECYCSSWIALNCLYDGLTDQAGLYLAKSQEMNHISGETISEWMRMHLTSIQAFLETERGNHDEAIRLHREVLEEAESCNDTWVAGDALFELFFLIYPQKDGLEDIARKLKELARESHLPHLEYKAALVEAFLDGKNTEAVILSTLDKVAAGKLPSVDEVRAFRLCLQLSPGPYREKLEDLVRDTIKTISSNNPDGKYTERTFIKESLKAIRDER